MKPAASASIAAPEDVLIGAAQLERAKRRAALELAQQPDQRRAARAGRGGRRGVRWRAGEHRVDLVGRHRQAQQQLLVGDPLPKSLARALEADRLELRSYFARG